jgi:hypothetical protein
MCSSLPPIYTRESPAAFWQPSEMRAHGLDPVVTNLDNYKVAFENEFVQLLDYTDEPGHKSTPLE